MTRRNFIFKHEDIEKVDIDKLLSSEIFIEIIDTYISQLKPHSKALEYLRYFSSSQSISMAIASFFRKLYNNELENFQDIEWFLFQSKDDLLALIDGIYDTWRSSIRYLIGDKDQIGPHELITSINSFSKYLIDFYRKIYEFVLGDDQRVYRELASGVNGGLLLYRQQFELPINLCFLDKIPTISSIVIKPPFMVKTSCNKRTGIFEFNEIPLCEADITFERFYLLPLAIDSKLALCYVHEEFLSAIMGLGTLFEVADSKFIKTHAPKMILVYGAKTANFPYYYKEDGIYIGVLPLSAKMDYFGYAKKMLLTLFNLTSISLKRLPIHGAGILVTLSDGRKKTIAILGDSGAGKSETIEALKGLEDSRIAELTTIFDDMGTFVEEDGKIFMSGTEIGAFVRLDDLDKSYSLKSIDRAIFYNPEQTNSRVVIPITPYLETIKRYPVDIFLYANNYEACLEGVKMIEDLEKAKEIFKRGSRVAMKTTSEQGLVETFFANPFGPMQKRDEVEPIIDRIFSILFENKVDVGILYTNLANDPKAIATAAKGLLNYLQK